MYENFKQVLFKLDAEKAHSVAEFFLRKVAPLPLVQDLAAKRKITACVWRIRLSSWTSAVSNGVSIWNTTWG